MVERLSERQRDVLRYIVQSYVDSNAPVASKRITAELLPQFSSATVRNDMAELERLGLITHLHTSAGRIPTDLGYRYFVESLMAVPELSPRDQMLVRHQFHQVALQLEQWTRLAAAVLARMAGLAAVVTAPQLGQSRLKHVELVSVQEAIILVVVVTQAGAVQQSVVALDEPVTQLQLRSISDSINARHADQTADAIALDVSLRSPLETALTREVTTLLRGGPAGTSGDQIVYDGVANVLRAPEFAQQERAQRLMELMRDGGFVRALLPYAAAVGEVQVLIGDENPWDELRQCAVVLARYGAGANIAGLVGVIGPTRMPYERSIATVRFMAGLMSDLLMDMYSV
jgi:heat-inducible transcriptional repressor